MTSPKFLRFDTHSKLLAIAIPLILANITTPLLGLVDTAILGRMDGLHFLAGAAIGSLILTQLYWVCGFLKMSMTGLSAQAKGHSSEQRIKTLVQGMAFALVLALMILLCQQGILRAGLYFAQSSEAVSQSTTSYFTIRVWGAPAALLNLAIIGWLIGQQKSRLILLLQILVNIVNIIASLAFVYGFGMGVDGVAAGTVLAEYSMLMISLAYIHKRYLRLWISLPWLAISALKPLLSLNSDMLIRNLFLQFTLAFITLKGAQFGAQAAAVNAILMQFFALIALGLDGIANAVEALVGEKAGEKADKKIADSTNNKSAHQGEVNHQVGLGLFWSSAVALLYTLVFYLAAEQILSLLTNQESLIVAAQDYIWVILLLPIIAHWCFLFDGVYVGLTRAKIMRNNMILSTVAGFLPCYFLLAEHGNQALWIAMFIFLGIRGFGLAGHYYYKISGTLKYQSSKRS